MRFRRCYEKTIATSAAPPWFQQQSNPNSAGGGDSGSGRGGTVIHRKHLIVDLQRADERMHSIIVRSDQLSTEWTEYNAIRNKIKVIVGDLIKHEMKFCRQHNVEQYIWKTLYYNVIETTRRMMDGGGGGSGSSGVAAGQTDDCYRSVCASVIDDGLDFFDSLIQTLTDTYNFQLDQFVGAYGGRSLKGLKYVALAVVSAQKFCMCKGDLLRYREQIKNGREDFRAAKRWYVKAYELIPSNGMPSNQLAILSLYEKRKFDAIFYHMRSLYASNPIKSAKESLVILFDELRKKYQQLEAQRNSRRTVDSRATDTRPNKVNEKFKREIWVHPTDGQLNYRTVFLSQGGADGGDGVGDGDGDGDAEALDSMDLYKKFIFHFSCVHGILFTKVGAELLDDCMVRTLKQFQELLNHRTSGIFTLQKMVQMLAMNVLAIENCMRNATTSALTTAAISFAFAFIAITADKLKMEFDEQIQTGINASIVWTPRGIAIIKNINRFRLSDSVNNSMACVSLWCNWLRENRSIWTSANDLYAIHAFGQTFGLCVWNELAKLTTTFAQFDFDSLANVVIVCTGDTTPPPAPAPNHVKFRLPEEMLTLGMTQLLLTDNLYCRKDDDDGDDVDNRIMNVSSFQRMKNIYGFCSTDLVAPVVTQLNARTGRMGERALLQKLKSGEFISTNICDADKAVNIVHGTVTMGDSCANAASSTRNSISDSDDAENDVIERCDDDDDDNGSSTEIQKLVQRKNELVQSHKMHEKHSRFTQEILQKDTADAVACIEIRPKYLVPDTNCYIDFLREIKQLADTYPLYHIIVPIVVLNELEGLAKGDVVGAYGTPAKTSQFAQKALTFLKTVGTAVKCATTKGSLLNSMAYTKESDCPASSVAMDGPSAREYHLNNDDKILLTVVNLAKTHTFSSAHKSTGAASAGTNLQRKIVLLTNDRNLKLKAIAQNIPVRELIDFIKWSGINK